MRLRHIEIFHAVYMTGSVSGAAKALNVSQPTVSKVLRHAEDQLGFELFYREKGRVFPTEKGELLFKQVLPVFEQINELRKYSSMLASTKMGRLRLAMTPAFSLEVVPKALAKFAKKHPEVSIEVETLHGPEITKAILNNTVDVGLLYEAVEVPGIAVHPIGLTGFICVAPEEYNLPDKNLTLEALQDLQLILLNAKSPLGQRLNNKLQDFWGGSGQGHIIAETYHLAKRLSVQGAGAAVIDKITAYSGAKDGLSFHELEGFGDVNIHVLTRVNDPIIGFKKDFVELLAVEIKNLENK